MKFFKQVLLPFLAIIFFAILVFFILDYFDFFKQSKFDLPNRYQKENAPLIISGTASVSEVLEDLAYKNTVGLSSDTDTVNEYYKNITRIGSSKNLNISLINKINADIFLSDKKSEINTRQAFSTRKNNSMQFSFLDFSTYQACLSSITEIGKITNKEKDANQIIQTIEAKILEIRREFYYVKSPRVLLLIHSDSNIFMGTEYSFLGSILSVMNIHNIANDLNTSESKYLFCDLKKIKDLNIDLIINIHENDFKYEINSKNLINNLINNLEQKNEFILKNQIRLLQENNFCKSYLLDKSYTKNATSLNIIDIAEKLKELIYLK